MAAASPPRSSPKRRGAGLRAGLDRLYKWSGALAALFLVAICAIVMAQVTANAVDALMQWATGRPIGLVVPSYAEFAGFFLAAASFLALPHALRAGAHIRVTSVLDRLAPRARLAAEVWCSAAGAALSGYFTWYSLLLVVESLRYGDVSPGMVPVPLWIPQAAMSLGLVILTVAFADRCVSLLAGVWPGDGGEDPAAPMDRLVDR